MTFGGLVKHLALIEADWLAVKRAGQPYGPPWDSVDFDADPDWDWCTGASDERENSYALWHAAIDRFRTVVTDVIAQKGLDGAASFVWPNGRTPTVHDVLIDIEEYARHTGPR